MSDAGGYEEYVVRNHDEKSKNMQRSVLPSTRRKAAREERRSIHKRARARERDTLTEARKTLDSADVDPDPDFREGRRKAATHWMVLDRRAADKIGPLTHWAIRTVEADTFLRNAALHEQVAHFESLLPTDLIGQHAVFHIALALEWEFHPDARRRFGGPPPGLSREERRAQAVADAYRIIEVGRHRELNVALRRAYAAGPPPRRFGSPVSPPPVRLLRGLHDVDDFASEVSRVPWVCGVVARVARTPRSTAVARDQYRQTC